jgi:hypothetical protein
MAEANLARSALEKLAGIEEQLKELYATVDAVKDLELGLNILHDNTEQQHQTLIQEFDNTLSDCEQHLNRIKKTFRVEMEFLDEKKGALSNEIQLLIYRKEELDGEIKSLLINAESQQKLVNNSVSQIKTQQLDLQSLENKLTRAFAGLDEDIASKLTMYENKLSHSNSDSQAKIDQLLSTAINEARMQSANLQMQTESTVNELRLGTNQVIQQVREKGDELESNLTALMQMIRGEQSYFKEVLQQQIIEHLNNLDSRFDVHVENNKQYITDAKGQLQQALENTMNKMQVSIVQIASDRLDEIQQEQTKFIERQTALINNNTQQIDQIQRVLNYSQEQTKESEKFNNDKFKQIQEELKESQYFLNNSQEQLNDQFKKIQEEFKESNNKIWQALDLKESKKKGWFKK